MKILFVHNYLATFTRIDLEILRSAHHVREWEVRRDNVPGLLHTNAGLPAAVAWADLVFAWFGGYHALLPFLLAKAQGRKCVVVASGYDVAAQPEIDYGNMRPGIRRPIGRQVFALADRVLPVSEFARGEAQRNAGVPDGKMQVIPHGVDTAQFRPPANDVRPFQVLTVASVKQGILRTKGLPTFVQAAAALPDVPFLIAGPYEQEAAAQLCGEGPPNIRLLGPQRGSELVALMQQSAVYAQLSAYESFGMAVAEAMACGCAPVVSNRGALPEVVGDAGYVAPYGDVAATVTAIGAALARHRTVGVQARRRVCEVYPLARRQQALLGALDAVQKGKR
jgi:glycosyltransferase involved in cell wall biosynthesis